MQITSKDNPVVKEARQLKTAKARRETGLFIAEGPHLVGELLRSDFRIKRVFTIDKYENPEIKNLLHLSTNRNIPVFELSEAVYKTLCETEQPQGILAVACCQDSPKLPAIPPNEKAIVLVADRIQDPGNMGTLIRTAWGFGVKLCIMTPGSVDPFNAKVLRSSMGGVFHLPILHAEINEILTWAEEQRMTLYAGDPSDRHDLRHVSFAARTGIIVGNEGAGLSNGWEASKNMQKIYIPMPGQAESLNVTIAASIMLYEASSQIIC